MNRPVISIGLYILLFTMSTKLPYLDWNYQPLVDSFRAFKARIGLYFEDKNITDDAKQSIKLKIAWGDEGMRRLLASGLSDNELKDPKVIFDFLETQLDGTLKINFRVHRLEYSHLMQNTDEPITTFVSRLREKASKCKFEVSELNERLIELIILSTPYEEFRKELLTYPKGYNISKVIEKCREYEAIKASITSLTGMKPVSLTVNAIGKTNKCANCGLIHAKRSCSAYNSKCHSCDNMGHWKKSCRKTVSENKQYVCKTKKYWRNNNKQSHAVDIQHCSNDENNTSATSSEINYYAIQISNLALKPSSPNEVYTTLSVKYVKPCVNGPLRLKVGTGSDGNTLPLRTYKQMFGTIPTQNILTPEPHVKLTSYSGHPIVCCGSINLSLSKPKGQFQVHTLFVVDVVGPAILGLPSCKQLDVITLNPVSTSCTSLKNTYDAVNIVPSSIPPNVKLNTVSDLKWWFPDCFDAVGEFKGEVKLHLKPDSTPYIDAPRRTPVHILPKITAQLKSMESDGIIKKVEHHTDWCSSVTYASKHDGSLRICLDPQKLNLALKRCPHKIPTVEEINPELNKAKYFSKLDAKAGYWSVKLDKESSELTTFRTPVGRYCFRRLPFGLAVIQDIFQLKIDQILEQCDGCCGISDDIIIFGTTEEEHDRRLLHFFNVARK